MFCICGEYRLNTSARLLTPSSRSMNMLATWQYLKFSKTSWSLHNVNWTGQSHFESCTVWYDKCRPTFKTQVGFLPAQRYAKHGY